MFKLLFVIVLLIASVWVGLTLAADPGYMLISINHWSIETTLWTALMGFFILLLAAYLVVRLTVKLWHIPTTLKRWRRRHNKRKSNLKTRKGLIEFSEGYWRKAKSDLIKALPGSEAPLLNYLTAARAAQELGDYTLRDDYLRQAQQSMPEAKIAVELTQAQLQLANQQWEQALATLQHLHSIAPHHPYVLKLLMKLYEQVRDWPKLISLLPEIKRHGVAKGDAFTQIQLTAYIEAMKDSMKNGHFGEIEKLFKARPKDLSYHPEIIAEYSRYLIKTEKYPEAESLIRKALSHQFNETLILEYGQLKDKGAKLSFAEHLLTQHPNSSALLLCLGQLSIAQNLWGKARGYLEQSIQYKPSALAFYELGNLLQQLNNQTHALEAYKQGIALNLMA